MSKRNTIRNSYEFRYFVLFKDILKCIKNTAVSISALMASFSVGLPSMLNVKTAEKTVSPVAIKINQSSRKVISQHVENI